MGNAHHFHTRNPEPDPARQKIDDPYTKAILWPNYHSGANGNYQDIEPVGDLHSVLRDVRYLPAHPHEGAVGAPPDDPTARVIARGHSKITGVPFNVAVAFEPVDGNGPAIAQSTFHHFADYNWDTSSGCPTFVDEPPSDRLLQSPEAMQSVKAYMRNVALWLAQSNQADQPGLRKTK